MNVIGNIIGQNFRRVAKFVARFFFKKSIVWIDNVTLSAENEVVSNVDWELKVGEVDE